MDKSNHLGNESRLENKMNAGRGLEVKVPRKDGRLTVLSGSMAKNTKRIDWHMNFSIGRSCLEKSFATIATILRAATLDTYLPEVMLITFTTAIQKAEEIWNEGKIATTRNSAKTWSEKSDIPRIFGVDKLAAIYPVGRTMIFAIVKRHRWKHVK